MSSAVIREWFRTQVAAVNPAGCPFYETVNKMPNPQDLPALWCTVEFTSSSEERLTLGEPGLYRESGQVHVAVLGKSGKGDALVVNAAEALRPVFEGVMEVVGPGHFRIESVSPPSTDLTESGDWFLAGVTCAYVFDVVR